ncbi:uncharacterized protein CLUP02_06622 [Colletotrichum lupini]|uniref:Uncharacterized protein n=1 Tax=Colletotrichum lupini TaxID=145971 RepID=A0A9Q8SPL3_9PEZI|nr:uncharacterized protein CLUP02_06622 [Colletotrichum lupini]UQC81136.1 hypothetical protein CLUP02_06622 [Colletotrichum lupini]
MEGGGAQTSSPSIKVMRSEPVRYFAIVVLPVPVGPVRKTMCCFGRDSGGAKDNGVDGVRMMEKRKDEETIGRQGLGRSFLLLFSHLQDQPNKHQTFQNDMTTYDETETATEPTLGRPLTKLANVEIKKKSQSLSTTAPFGCGASGHFGHLASNSVQSKTPNQDHLISGLIRPFRNFEPHNGWLLGEATQQHRCKARKAPAAARQPRFESWMDLISFASSQKYLNRQQIPLFTSYVSNPPRWIPSERDLLR